MNESDALKTASHDIATSSQDELLIDSDLAAVADIGVQAAMEFFTGDKVIVPQQHVEEESNKVSLYFKFESTIYRCK